MAHRLKMRCSGMELLVIFMFFTGYLGIIPFLAFRLAILELVCIIALVKLKDNVILSWPLKCFVVFLVWIIFEIFITPKPTFGFRMLLKYLYPFLFALLTSAVVKDKEVFLKSMLSARWMALISLICLLIPALFYGILSGLFWTVAALCTNYITIAMFSLSLIYVIGPSIKNIIWTVLFISTGIIFVLRTDIFGMGAALAIFFFIKYRLKSIPLVLFVGCLGLAAMFYIPKVKSKMYYRPEEVTITDFLTGNVDENNINTSGRKKGWEDMQIMFFDPHKLTGSGTGRIQTYFYTEATGWQRGGQLHNDFLVLLCDNGIIGLSLFAFAYLAIMCHCLIIHKRTDNKWIKLCSLTAGSALIGVMITMYSDNTISYSMCTLGYPWGLYGMALGMYRREQQELLQLQ